MQICVDGQWFSKDEAKVSVFDHGLLYGDGVFEGIRAYHGRVFRLDEHIRRLFDSARTIQLKLPLTPAEFAAKVVEACRRNSIENGYIRAVVTRGVGDLGLDPRKCPKPSYFIIVADIQPYPEQRYDEGLKIITCATRRNSPTALDPGIKSLNYLNNIFARMEANRAGADEGLMLNQQGYVSEATVDNIFVVRDGRVHTPPIGANILKGVTRDTVIELAGAEGLEVIEEYFTTQYVYNGDECFLTGTAAEVIPVVEVDERPIGDGRPGTITRRLIQAFREHVEAHGTPIA